MLFCDFQHKIRKLNPLFSIDTNHEISAYHPDFATAGLYYDNKYVCAIAHRDVPEYTIEEPKSQRILAPGIHNVVQFLINKGYVSQTRAERIFGRAFHPRGFPIGQVRKYLIDLVMSL